MATSDSSAAEVGHLLDVVVRRERGRLISSLAGRLGIHHLDLAEDVAQEAVLAALARWPYEGVPDNPAAWLTRVAGNKAIDRLRRESREQAYDVDSDPRPAVPEAPVDVASIADPELRLMFLCCHPALGGIDQLALTLRIVSGFTAREIAEIFLSTEPAMAQRLSRSKRKLRRSATSLTAMPTATEIESRLDAVLKVVYLMFSLGYSPRSGGQLVRRDVAREAVRLARELADRKPTATPEAYGLSALLCFQASRLEAREDDEGRPVLLRDQDRARWDRTLIESGLGYLRSAMQSDHVSRYHLEAGIASIYATAASWGQIDWKTILTCYGHLEQIADSPIVSLNACVAQAFAGEPEQSLSRVEAIGREPILASYAPYHIARAEILRLLGREAEAKESFCAAVESGASAAVIQHLEHRLATTL